MSFEITTAFVQQYSDNIEMLSQQKGSRLRAAVNMKDGIKGKKYFHDQIDATTAQKRTNRHADTPLISTPHRRRMLTLYDYDWADLIDDLDKVKMLSDPTSPYAMNAANAMGRAMDDEIIVAANATAYTGEDGTTSTSFPAGMQIAHGSTGMTLAKLLSTKQLLDVSEDLETKRHIVVSSEEIAYLLALDQISSSDYNTIKALVQGEVRTFVGFEFHQSERLSVSSTTGIRLNLAWIEDGMLLGIGKDIVGKISERADKNHATQPYYCMSIGSTRTDEKKVVEIGAYHA